MRTSRLMSGILTLGFLVLWTGAEASGQHGKTPAKRPKPAPVVKGTTDPQPLRLAAYSPQDKPKTGSPKEEPVKETTTVRTEERTVGQNGEYKEVSDFFNVREANSNVSQGEWEFEAPFAWETASDGGDDDTSAALSLKYGITNDLFAELEVMPMNFGDGDEQGNGDLSLVLFNQWVHESDGVPAFATWAEMRMPSGEGSSGVDGELHFNLTKTMATNFRGHLEGFIETANGGRGDEDENRRHFQWGIGPGIDYQCSENTIGVINYVNRSGEEYGNSNQNIVQVGLARKIAENQWLKAAADIGVDGRDETPNFGVKLQWSIEW